MRGRPSRFAAGVALGLSLLLPSPSPAQTPEPASPAPAPPSETIDDREIDPIQPDFLVVNLPTNLRVPKHAMTFFLTHRFSRPLGEGDFGDLVADLFGFDSGAQVGLGLRFGLFDGTELGLYRTNDRAIQLSVKEDLFQQGDDKPLSLGLYGTLTGRDNFSEVFSPVVAVIAGRKLGSRASVYAIPGYAWNVSANEEETGDDTFFLGVGSRLLLGRGVSLVAEWTGRFGYDGLDPVNPLLKGADNVSFGIEKRVGGHAFQLNFSNGFGTTFTSLARGSTQDDWFIGFNLSRKFY